MKRFKNILCIVDYNNTNSNILERSIALAKSNDAKLTVATVIEPVEDIFDFFSTKKSAQVQDQIIKESKKKIIELINEVSTQVDLDIKVMVGVVFLEIIYEVLRNKHDLVIKAPQTADWKGKIFGSIDMHLLRKCPCPVWMIRENAPKTFDRIVAAIDVDDIVHSKIELETQTKLNKKIIQLAASLAISDLAELDIIHAWYAQGESTMGGAFVDMKADEIAEYVNELQQKHSSRLHAFLEDIKNDETGKLIDYLKAKNHLIKGWPSDVIPYFVNQVKADLIVMGTVGRTGIPGFIMGNTAENILNQIDCSVLAVKPEDFVSPVELIDK